MKKGDRVNIGFGRAGVCRKDWEACGIDESSLGTIATMNGHNISVSWDNGCYTVCSKIHLKPYKEEDIPLPNVKFRRKQV